MRCSNCNGMGTNTAIVARTGGCDVAELTCRRCEGTGETTAERERVAAWQEQLRRQRRGMRLDKELSLVAAAREKGVSVREYNDWEWAKDELPPVGWMPEAVA